MTKTKYINQPASKDHRRALRFAGYDQLKKRKTDFSQANTDEYGVELSYIPPGTFHGQSEGYLRYLLATGGPREEIRFYHSPGARKAYKILFIYTDYTSGVSFDVTDEEWCRALFETFLSSGTLEEHRQKAI